MTAISLPSKVIAQTPLDKAILSGETQKVRDLLASKASPTVASFGLAQKNIPMLLILLNQEHSRYKSCKSPTSFCAALFPPIRELPSEVLDNLESIPLSEPFKRFIKAVDEFDPKELRSNLVQVMERVASKLDAVHTEGSREAFLARCTTLAPIDVVQQALVELHPLFAKGWELANHPQPMNLVEHSDNGKIDFNWNTNTLTIGKFFTVQDIMKNLVYWMVFSLNRSSHQLFNVRTLPREVYVIHRIYYEFKTREYRDILLSQLSMNTCKASFADFWNSQMTGSPSRIDKMRAEWEILLPKFLAQNPGVVRGDSPDEKKGKA